MYFARRPLISLVLIGTFLASCGGQPAAGEPTPDVNATIAAGAQTLVDEGLAVQQAGCFSIVLEMVALETAAEMTRQLAISTIGIGAGLDCDGQVLVWHDLIGLSEHSFRFVKKFADAQSILSQATTDYVNEVQNATFPSEANGWKRTS